MLRYDLRRCSQKIANKRGITCKEAKSILKDVLDVIVECVSMKVNEPAGVAFKGYFTMTPYITPARKCLDPGSVTGELMTVPSHRAIRIRYGEAFREKMNP